MFILILVVRTSWQTRIPHRNVSLLQTPSRKPLELEAVTLLHIDIGKRAVSLWFGVVTELTIDFFFRTSFINCYVFDIDPFCKTNNAKRLKIY